MLHCSLALLLGDGLGGAGADAITAAALFAGVDQSVALQHGEVLADAGGGEAQEAAQLLDGGAALSLEVLQDVLAGGLHLECCCHIRMLAHSGIMRNTITLNSVI